MISVCYQSFTWLWRNLAHSSVFLQFIGACGYLFMYISLKALPQHFHWFKVWTCKTFGIITLFHGPILAQLLAVGQMVSPKHAAVHYGLTSPLQFNLSKAYCFRSLMVGLKCKFAKLIHAAMFFFQYQQSFPTGHTCSCFLLYLSNNILTEACGV